MKIKSVNIQGMHKVHNTTYDLSDCNYLCGKNGSGKSTVLQAIQLAILGYIPGYPKRNQDIVKHANSKLMSVKVTFDDDNYIERTYLQTGSKVSCDIDTSLEDIDSITSDIEMPIYNFSSFLALSPNEQKKWFLGFLPKEYDFKFKWKEMFDKEVSNLPEYNEDYVAEIADEITARGCSTVEEVCEYIKSIISFAKAQINSKQAVLSDLMYYEDVGTYNLESVEAEIKEKQEQCSNCISKYSVYADIKQRKSVLDSCKQFISEQFEDEPAAIAISEKIAEIDNALTNLHDEISEKTDEYNAIELKYNQAKNELSSCVRPTEVDGSCPYLPDIECKMLASHKRDLANKYKEVKAIFDKEQETYDVICADVKELSDKESELMLSKANLTGELNSLRNEYERYLTAKKNYDDFIETIDFDIFDILNGESSIGDLEYQTQKLNQEINELTDIKIKLVANEKYKEILDSNQKELNTWENNLVILEKLKDYTGPNRLQAELAEKPFLDLSVEITEYLRKMFNDDTVECWFNLSTKSNSFEFGIVRDNTNIPFTVLSSGEQCMYMLALQSALMISNKQDFNTILIDDAFDHLDNDNIISLVGAILDTDAQYIIAGVASIPETKELKKLNRIQIGG